MSSDRQTVIGREILERFCAEAFVKAGLPAEDAVLSAKVLVSADARGIPSHGVGRMMRYIRGLECRQMLPGAKPVILRESPVSVTVDAGGAMGFPVSFRTMSKVIEKAEKTGMACGCVRNSNHFGIAGFYAMMALEHDMIGVAMTNTAAPGLPDVPFPDDFDTSAVGPYLGYYRRCEKHGIAAFDWRQLMDFTGDLTSK